MRRSRSDPAGQVCLACACVPWLVTIAWHLTSLLRPRPSIIDIVIGPIYLTTFFCWCIGLFGGMISASWRHNRPAIASIVLAVLYSALAIVLVRVIGRPPGF
jgi:hypothetical protein